MEQLQLSPPPAPTELPWKRTRIRVPRNDGGLLAIPHLSDVTDSVADNRDALEQTGSQILGRSLQDIRRQARSEALEAACRFTSRILGRDCDAAAAAPVIATGHQPELFHPGVWVKQFAVTELARRTGGSGLNLIVDSDMMRSHRVRIPVGTRTEPGTDWITLDTSGVSGPWQDVRIQDQASFESFGSRVAKAMSNWGVTPLLQELWSYSVEHQRHGSNLAECLSAGRMQTEWNWGEGNLELPLSDLCATDAFLLFAVDLLHRADEFRETYNAVLSEYRAVNRIRSESHPVPELAHSHGWTEAPFMVWQTGDQKRRHVFVRRADAELQLASSPDEAAVFVTMPLTTDGDATRGVEALRGIQTSGWRFRTRALTTTMYTRLCLTDLFVHGIGGAKYDEMTDRIMSRFYNVCPPAFLTLSATVWLPIAEPFSDTDDDVRRIRAMLRELQHNSQRHLQPGISESIDSLLTEKQRLIEAQHRAKELPAEASHTSGFERYQRFPEINRLLAQQTLTQRQQLLDEQAEVEHRIQANAVLTGREYSFCLYPAERIQRMIAETHAAFDG